MKSFVTLCMFSLILPQLINRCEADQVLCGVRAAYYAVDACGVERTATFDSLVHERFISFRQGSSADDVIRAVEHLGGAASRVDGCGIAALRLATTPLILHTTSEGQLDLADHWDLLLGVSGGDAKLVAADGKIYPMPLDSLLARWQGTMIVVESPADAASTLGGGWLVRWHNVVFALIMVAVGLMIHAGWKSFIGLSDRRGRVALMGLLLCVPIVCVLGFRGDVGSGPWTSMADYALATKGLLETDEIETADFLSHLEHDSATIVDCRYQRDFDYRHIPGAINIPVNSDFATIASKVDSIDLRRPCILICQSSGCRFSDVMAVRLREHGVSRIQLYRGGYVGYRNAKSG